MAKYPPAPGFVSADGGRTATIADVRRIVDRAAGSRPAGDLPVVLVQQGTVYPTRPAGAVHAIYKGSATPTDAVDGDEWIQT